MLLLRATTLYCFPSRRTIPTFARCIVFARFFPFASFFYNSTISSANPTARFGPKRRTISTIVDGLSSVKFSRSTSLYFFQSRIAKVYHCFQNGTFQFSVRVRRIMFWNCIAEWKRRDWLYLVRTYFYSIFIPRIINSFDVISIHIVFHFKI